MNEKRNQQLVFGFFGNRGLMSTDSVCSQSVHLHGVPTWKPRPQYLPSYRWKKNRNPLSFNFECNHSFTVCESTPIPDWYRLRRFVTVEKNSPGNNAWGHHSQTTRKPTTTKGFRLQCGLSGWSLKRMPFIHGWLWRISRGLIDRTEKCNWPKIGVPGESWLRRFQSRRRSRLTSESIRGIAHSHCPDTVHRGSKSPVQYRAL